MLRLKRVARWVHGKPVLSVDSTLDLSRGNALLFADAMRDHGGGVPIKKIQDPVMHSPETGPKLMDAVS
jgi:hypothetical protein